MATKTLIPYLDYERIYKLTYSVLEVVGGHTERACLLFSAVGLFILRTHYNLPATLTAGAAAFMIDPPSESVLLFGRFDEQSQLTCDAQNFHAWVECNGFVLDFMSPIFRESIQSSGASLPVVPPRLMFQRRRCEESTDFADMRRAGDFLLVPNLQLTHELVDNLDAKPHTSDLIEICKHYYKKPPEPWAKGMAIGDSKEGPKPLAIRAPDVVGKW